MPDPKDRMAGIKRGESREVKAGDLVVIPPGTAHWFSRINGHITYVEVRLRGTSWQRNGLDETAPVA